jgi:hypothetical protein
VRFASENSSHGLQYASFKMGDFEMKGDNRGKRRFSRPNHARATRHEICGLRFGHDGNKNIDPPNPMNGLILQDWPENGDNSPNVKVLTLWQKLINFDPLPMRFTFTAALVVLLVLAWIVTGPLFRLHDKIKLIVATNLKKQKLIIN